MTNVNTAKFMHETSSYGLQEFLNIIGGMVAHIKNGNESESLNYHAKMNDRGIFMVRPGGI